MVAITPQPRTLRTWWPVTPWRVSSQFRQVVALMSLSMADPPVRVRQAAIMLLGNGHCTHHVLDACRKRGPHEAVQLTKDLVPRVLVLFDAGHHRLLLDAGDRMGNPRQRGPVPVQK